MGATTLEKMTKFIERHHLLALATVHENQPYGCSVFYAFDAEQVCFIVASDMKTQHIRNVLHNPNVAAVIALETRDVSKIQGIQIQGVMTQTAQKRDQQLYFKHFAYAKVMQPTLWRISIDAMKFTDNRLGFGSKLMWQRDSLES